MNNSVFDKLVALAVFVALASCTLGTAMAQQSKHKPPSPLTMQRILQLLNRPEVQKELELDRSQIGKIAPLLRAYPLEVQAELSKIQMLPSTKDQIQETLKEQQEAHREKEQEIGEAFGEKLDEILLPFQRERVGQLGMQLLFAKPTFVSVFKAREVAEQAGLTDRQARQLSRVASEAETEYLKELRELKLKYHEQVRTSFDPEIRAAVEEILGKPYVTVPEIKQHR